MGKDGKKSCHGKKKVEVDDVDWDDDKREKDKKDSRIPIPKPCPAPISMVLTNQVLLVAFNATLARDRVGFLTQLVNLALGGNVDACLLGLIVATFMDQRAVEEYLDQIFAYQIGIAFTLPALQQAITQLYNYIINFLCNQCLWPCNWKECPPVKCMPLNPCNVCSATQKHNPCDPCSGAYGCGF